MKFKVTSITFNYKIPNKVVVNSLILYITYIWKKNLILRKIIYNTNLEAT